MWKIKDFNSRDENNRKRGWKVLTENSLGETQEEYKGKSLNFKASHSL